MLPSYHHNKNLKLLKPLWAFQKCVNQLPLNRDIFFKVGMFFSSYHSLPDTVQRGELFSLQFELAFYFFLYRVKIRWTKGPCHFFLLLYWPTTLWSIWIPVMDHCLAWKSCFSCSTAWRCFPETSSRSRSWIRFIFNLKRSHMFMFNDTSPFQYPTSTFLASDVELSVWFSLRPTKCHIGP